jgi:hypothetical protein
MVSRGMFKIIIQKEAGYRAAVEESKPNEGKK